MENTDQIEEIARRLYIALDNQLTALTGVYGIDAEKWPRHMKEAYMALVYATLWDHKWPSVKIEKKNKAG